jgi:hypothetical protein
VRLHLDHRPSWRRTLFLICFLTPLHSLIPQAPVRIAFSPPTISDRALQLLF